MKNPMESIINRLRSIENTASIVSFIKEQNKEIERKDNDNLIEVNKLKFQIKEDAEWTQTVVDRYNKCNTENTKLKEDNYNQNLEMLDLKQENKELREKDKGFYCQHKIVLDCKEQCHKCKDLTN